MGQHYLTVSSYPCHLHGWYLQPSNNVFPVNRVSLPTVQLSPGCLLIWLSALLGIKVGVWWDGECATPFVRWFYWTLEVRELTKNLSFSGLSIWQSSFMQWGVFYVYNVSSSLNRSVWKVLTYWGCCTLP